MEQQLSNDELSHSDGLNNILPLNQHENSTPQEGLFDSKNVDLKSPDEKLSNQSELQVSYQAEAIAENNYSIQSNPLLVFENVEEKNEEVNEEVLEKEKEELHVSQTSDNISNEPQDGLISEPSNSFSPKIAKDLIAGQMPLDENETIPDPPDYSNDTNEKKITKEPPEPLFTSARVVEQVQTTIHEGKQ